jgi:hypothetical protein
MEGNNMSSSNKPHWAPRVPPAKLRRLYELDARGIADHDLLVDIGYRLYSRCQSILAVTRIQQTQIAPCAQCERDVALGDNWSNPAFVLRCSACGWELSWEAYRATFRYQELGGGGANDIFEAYLAEWEAALTPREQMIAIDQLLHRWHWETKQQRPSFGLGRPTAANLIEGSRKQVIDFLDSLTYGDASTAGLQDSQQAWRAKLAAVREKQGARPNRKPSTANPEDDLGTSNTNTAAGC